MTNYRGRQYQGHVHVLVHVPFQLAPQSVMKSEISALDQTTVFLSAPKGMSPLRWDQRRMTGQFVTSNDHPVRLLRASSPRVATAPLVNSA